MEDDKIRVLFVDDNKVDRLAFLRSVKRDGLPYEPFVAESVAKGIEMLENDVFDVALFDYSLKDGKGFDLLRKAPKDTPSIIVTGSGNEEIAVKAMKLGASDYLIKDGENNWLKTLPITVNNALKAIRAERELRKAWEELERRVDERTRDLVEANSQLLQEIDQRKQAEKALRDSQAKFKALTETTSEWIWEMDTKGYITYASPRVESLLGYGPKEVIGKRKPEFMTPIEQDKFLSHYELIVASEKPFRELKSVNTHKDGRLISLESSGVPFFNDNGKLAGYRGIDLDITEKRKAEELLVKSERIKAVADLAAGVAHNFNNLLQIVISGIELALNHVEAGNSSKASSTLEQVLESAGYGSETAKWLQDFAQSGVGTTLNQGKTFSLTKTVEQAIEMSRPWWKSGPEREGINVKIETDFQNGCLIAGREGEIFEVLVNLIKNAAEALPAGGKINISTRVEGGWAELIVKDNGVGIREECLGKVFEPFYTTKGFRGTGMGLASALGLVRGHGGDITVSSKEGEGAQFRVQLPLANPDSGSDDLDSDMFFPLKLRILIIDDQEQLLEMLKQGFTILGQTVYAANSGQEGISIFERHDLDLIISDLAMPDINGWQVGKHIKERREAANKEKPLFILLTGWGESAVDSNRRRDSGVDEVVNKPINIQQLLTVIKNLLHTRGK
jgi:PAS domain S-box-containing protein